MDIFDLMWTRRSIRKYPDRQIRVKPWNRCCGREAGPQCRRRTAAMLVGLRDRTLVGRLGRVNAACMDRSGCWAAMCRQAALHYPTAQPSKAASTGPPAVCAVFAPENFLYSIPDAFCCAENMVLAATGLGLASCIVARGEGDLDPTAGGSS